MPDNMHIFYESVSAVIYPHALSQRKLIAQVSLGRGIIEAYIVFIFKEKIFREGLGTACLDQKRTTPSGWIWM